MGIKHRIKLNFMYNKYIIKNASVYDGLGSDKFQADILIDNGKASDLYINGLENFLKIIEKRKKV